MLEGGHAAVQAEEDVVGTSQVRELEKRVGDLERMLGKKTMEPEILREALDLARPKNGPRLCCRKAIPRTIPNERYCPHTGRLQVQPDRRVSKPSKPRGPYRKADDVAHPHSGLKFRSPREFLRLSA